MRDNKRTPNTASKPRALSRSGDQRSKLTKIASAVNAAENGSSAEPPMTKNLGNGACVPLLGSVVELAADRIFPGRWEHRLPQSYISAEFGQLKEAIAQTRGNKQPVAVRRLPTSPPSADGSPQYEIVTGHRRVRACTELDLPVRAIVLPDMGEPDLVALVYYENTSREPLKAYELGRMCAQALADGLFPSLRRMCAALKPLDVGSASRAVRLYQMPAALHELIRSPLQWQLKDVDKLTKWVEKEGFLARVDELKRLNGVMDREPLLRALAGVGSANEETVLEIYAGHELAGHIHVSSEGKVRMVLKHALRQQDAEDLRDTVEGLLGNWAPT